MSATPERRECGRVDHHAPIVYAMRDSDKFIDARMCDFSRRGMGFISARPVETGTEIYIMAEHDSPDAIAAEIYDGFLALVRWCEPALNSGKELFRVGVEYALSRVYA